MVGAALGSIMPTIMTVHIAKVTASGPAAQVRGMLDMGMSAMPMWLIIAASRHR